MIGLKHTSTLLDCATLCPPKQQPDVVWGEHGAGKQISKRNFGYSVFIVGRRGFSNMTEKCALPGGLSAIELERPVVFVGFSINPPKEDLVFPTIRQSSASHTADKHSE